MLNEHLSFNHKLTYHSALYRYPLWDESGEGIDMTWCVIIDNEKVKRKGDCYPIYEVPGGKFVLLDEFAWLPAWASPETFINGSIGRVTNDGEYHITLNAGCRSFGVQHIPLARPIPYFGGEWIGACPHLLGKAERTAFRMTIRFREFPAPRKAAAGKIEVIVPMPS